jgi:nitronate monooxygenase
MGSLLREHYPWTQRPLICSAPMRLISGSSLALAVSRAGGLGFIGAGAGSDLSTLPSTLQETVSLVSSSPIPKTPDGILPVGVGFLNWGADLKFAVREFQKHPLKPAAAWFFAPKSTEDLVKWTEQIRDVTQNKTKIWIQVGTVASALEVVRACKPDVLVIQGCDAGGHGPVQSSSIISLLPEVLDALIVAGIPRGSIPLVAAGGIMDGRGVAAALMLGASGACMGTRFLVSPEAEISPGYKKAIADANDGGVNTVRTTLYDRLRGTNGWPDGYNARGVINKSLRDSESGMDFEENQRLYAEAMKLGDEGWGMEQGRITTYAGTGVGLVREIMSAGQIVKDTLEEVNSLTLPRSGD